MFPKELRRGRESVEVSTRLAMNSYGRAGLFQRMTTFHPDLAIRARRPWLVAKRALSAPVAASGHAAVIKELPKNFDFASEERIYNWWESEGFFKPNLDKDEKPFVISMPPPNVTGALHMGHAMFVTLGDIITRHWQMRGYPSLWIPGTDHAGIATQLVVEKLLASQGVKRADLSREEFLKKV